MSYLKYVSGFVGATILLSLTHNWKDIIALIVGVFFTGYLFWERD